ncbi:TRAPP III complex Trs85 [Penicillium macrosclerotiorum]|uniref:TRAPP III complex Trs85 n=1 Tax=Penicillium macrosclerotiorum TaxID=303699 RepID=UPI00254805D1|nr:TRAPP III complex Trs85 [Penicillium macrosclerotiorum]KAJ5690627.1 TRAPP III complex Trs85 [Penicillium macrosclerotiorum]
MTSPGDATPVKPPPSFSPGTARGASDSRYPDEHNQTPSIGAEVAEPHSGSSPTPPLSTPTAELPIRTDSRSARSSTPQLARSSLGSPFDGRFDGSEDIRSLIIRAFSPTVAVYASEDTDELVRNKGFKGGFWELLRPFGETVPGKVVIRDSIGSSRAWEDYGVRFVDFKTFGRLPAVGGAERPSPLAQMEEVLEKQLESADNPLDGPLSSKEVLGFPATTPLAKIFLRQLLSATPAAPHETFSHPVASVITISSRNGSPLEALRQLYAESSTGDRRLPEWVQQEYLRYYVLVHDEERDDITESTKLYDQMKRHFGLHCHLLRLRSSQCVVTDDDSVQVPQCEWLSPQERLSGVGEAETLVDLGTDGTPYLFDSDASAIRTFVRELIVQSVIPFMENRVAVWNDQVASRRRGISGRFMSMSRRWAGFGSSSRSGIGGSSSGNSGNYDPEHHFYPQDSPEAILRKMADFAFMLRDWKLSASTYEMIRSDFGNDKAWKYHAGAHEMCAVSMLLNPLAMSAKIKLESVDQMFETACYSYLTRCSDAPHALRCLSLGVELLKSRGGSATESAARWAMRVMDFGLVGSLGQILFMERVAACYASKTPAGGAKWGARRRKAGMWSIFAADQWLKAGRPNLASACLEEAERLYADVLEADGTFPMPEMQSFVENLRHAVKVEYLQARGFDTRDEPVSEDLVGTEEISEKLDKRHHRRSLIGLPAQLDAGHLAMIPGARDPENTPSDDFERA